MSSNKYIISPDRLSQQLTDPNIVIIDCRFSLADINLGKSQYDRDHISGAYYLDLNQDLSDLYSKRLRSLLLFCKILRYNRTSKK